MVVRNVGYLKGLVNVLEVTTEAVNPSPDDFIKRLMKPQMCKVRLYVTVAGNLAEVDRSTNFNLIIINYYYQFYFLCNYYSHFIMF